MFPGSVTRITEALLKIPGVDATVAQEVADSLCDRNQNLEHHGQVTIRNTLPTQTRDYSPHGRPDNLHPVPPVNDPAITAALLTLDNRPIGNSDRRGENGFALSISNGIFRNQGESWIAKHCKVDAVTTVTDARSTRITTSGGAVTHYHYCADGFGCGDSKGRDLTDVPIRVFYPTAASLPVVSSIISYVRDQVGLAVPIGAEGAEGNLQWAEAVSPWEWHDEPAHVGVAVFNTVDTHHSLNTSATTTRIYVSGTQSNDPNVQVGDRVGWIYDANNDKTAVVGGLDAPIGRVVMHWGTPATIPGGWKVLSEMSARVPAGYDSGDTDYNTIGKTGGSHPIRPTEHSDSEGTSITSVSSSGWLQTAWRLWDHDPEAVTTATTGILVNVYTSPVLVTLGSTTGITINEFTAPAVDTESEDANVTIYSTTIPGVNTGTSNAAVTIASTTIAATMSVIAQAEGSADSETIAATDTGSASAVGSADSETIAATTSGAADANITLSSLVTSFWTESANADITVNATTLSQINSGGTAVSVTVNTTSVAYGPTSLESANLTIASSITEEVVVTVAAASLSIGGSATASTEVVGIAVNNHASHTHAAREMTEAYDQHTFNPNGTGATLSFNVTEAWFYSGTTDTTENESAVLTHTVTGDSHNHTISASGLTIANHDHDAVVASSLLYHNHTATGNHQHTLNSTSHGHSASSTSHLHTVSQGSHSHTATPGGHVHEIGTSSHTHVAIAGGHQHSVPQSDHGHSLTMTGHDHSVTSSIHGHSLTMTGHQHTVSSSIHTHTLTIGGHDHSVTSSSHIHSLTFGGHVHEITSTSHLHDITDPEHQHQIASTSHTHDITDEGHHHTTPTLEHSGSLYHAEEDFRDPYCTILFIRRVGPDDD